MKWLLILMLSSVVHSLSKGQTESGFIPWEKARPLTWNDFLAPAPQETGNTAALTVTHLGFSYSIVNGKLSFRIECEFEKNKSWGQVKNDWVLRHEQGHFDIAEIYARKLFKELSDYSFNQTTFEKDLGDIYQRIVNEKDEYQHLYDRETDHSRNTPKQEEWFIKIAGGLNESRDWASYH